MKRLQPLITMATELLDSYYQHYVVENDEVDDHKLMYRKLNRHRSSIPLCIHVGLWRAVAAKHMETLRSQASHCVVNPLNTRVGTLIVATIYLQLIQN